MGGIEREVRQRLPNPNRERTPMNDTVKAGFSLRDAASYIFRAFNEDFKIIDARKQDSPEGYLGEMTLNTEDGKDKLMAVSAQISHESGRGKNASSHYKCTFTIKRNNLKIKHGVFRPRTLKIKDNTLESKDRIISQIKEYYAQIIKLLSDAEDFNNKATVITDKNLELLAPELEKIKSSLGDDLKVIETVTQNGYTDVVVRIHLNSGECIFTNFNGEYFSLMLFGNLRYIKVEKLIAVIDALI